MCWRLELGRISSRRTWEILNERHDGATRGAAVKFYDHARPRLANGAPCWRDAPMIALPSIIIDPSETSPTGFDVRVMLPLGDGGAAWAERHMLSAGVVMELMLAWADDPELAVATWFGQKSPKARQRSMVMVRRGTGVVDI